ncbi:MAG: hypothetical protein ABEI53_00655 [Candidatus Magasanikbacteria bacterium]
MKRKVQMGIEEETNTLKVKKGSSDGDGWLRVQYRSLDDDPGRIWRGVLDAKNIEGVEKPELKSSTKWKRKSRWWRADLMSFVESSVCSPKPELREDFGT